MALAATLPFCFVHLRVTTGVLGGFSATLLCIGGITIVKLYSILQTDMIHKRMKCLICTWLKSTLSSTNSCNYKRSIIA